MISRQSNEPSIDFKVLRDEMLKSNPNTQVKMLCKKFLKNLEKNRVLLLHYKCMYHISTSNVCIVEGYVIPVSALKHKKG